MKTHWSQYLFNVLLGAALAVVLLAVGVVGLTHGSGIGDASSRSHFYSFGIGSDGINKFLLPEKLIWHLSQLLPGEVQLAGTRIDSIEVKLPESPAHAQAMRIELITGNYFPTLGVLPLAGRTINATDTADAARVVVLSASAAQRLFGSSQAAVGRFLSVNQAGLRSTTLQVIGVAPHGFHGVGGSIGIAADAWIPVTTPLTPLAKFTAYNRVGSDEKSMVPIVSARKWLSLRQVRLRIATALARFPESILPAGTEPILVKPYTEFFPQDHVLQLRRFKLYQDFALMIAALAAIGALAMRAMRAMRGIDALRLERVLGATRRWVSHRYWVHVLYTAVWLWLVGVFVVALLNVIIRRQVVHTPGHLQLIGIGFAHAAVTLTLTSVVAAICLEAPALLFLLTADSMHSAEHSFGRRMRLLAGSTTLTLEIMLSAIIGILAIWSLWYALQVLDVNLGMFHRPATLVAWGYSGGAGPSREELDSPTRGIDLLYSLSQAIMDIDRNAKIGYGPLPGKVFAAVRSYLGVSTYTKGHKSIAAAPMFASSSWFQAASVHLLAGRGFGSSALSASSYAVVIDSTVARALFGGVRRALGQSFLNNHGFPVRVIGVIAPLHLAGANEGAPPILLYNIRVLPKMIYLLPLPLVIGPAIPPALYPQLHAVINKVLVRQAPNMKLEKILSSTHLLNQLNAPQTHVAQVFLAIALFAWAIALSGVAAHLRLYLAMRKRVTAIRSALGAGPRWLYGEVLGGT